MQLELRSWYCKIQHVLIDYRHFETGQLSSVVEQCFRKAEVPGSNPGAGSSKNHLINADGFCIVTGSPPEAGPPLAENPGAGSSENVRYPSDVFDLLGAVRFTAT